MCTQTRLIKNKYTGRTLRVSCGKCPACLQQKANARTSRIRNHSVAGEVALFVTLTYAPKFLPYIRLDELTTQGFVNIYRNASHRYYGDEEKVKDEIDIIDSFYLSDLDNFTFHGLKSARGLSKGCVSVIYYKDLQDFVKRLRINLKRKFNYDNKITLFACAEYGPLTQRAHFHLLIFAPSDAYETLRDAIVKSWSYADRLRTSQYIEIAKDAASYVASYVNSPYTAGSLLSSSAFRQKHSCSKDFGVRLEYFSLAKILQAIERRDLRYNVPSSRNGVPSVDSVLIPKYVINRYFPKFKGYSILTDNEIRELCLQPAKLRFVFESKQDCNIKWTEDDVYKYSVRINHVFERFQSELGWTDDDFYYLYPRLLTDVWNLYFSNSLQDSFRLYELDPYNFYENINELAFGVRAPTLNIDLSRVQTDPNKRVDVVNTTYRLTDLYFKKDKSRKVVNLAMSETGHNV